MRAIKGGLSARGRARRAGWGGGGTLVALLLWLNNGREEMLTMADRGKPRRSETGGPGIARARVNKRNI